MFRWRQSSRALLGPILWISVASLGLPVAHAADPKSYTVNIKATGHGDLDTALKASSQLESLRRAPAGPFALVGRAQEDVDRLQTVLQGFGYYQGKISITIEGRALDDPGLPAAIEALPKEKNAAVDVDVDLGPLYHLRKVTIEGDIPEDIRARLGIAPGDPAVAAQVLKAQENLLNALQEADSHAGGESATVNK